VAPLPKPADDRSRVLLGRGLLALAATVLVAWFCVLARDHAIGTQASDRVLSDPGMSAAEWRAVTDDFRRVHLLDPSPDWSLIQAQYELLRDKRAALRRAEGVLRHEPDNLSAWWVVLRAAKGEDPERYRAAAAAIQRLDPRRTTG
jgi:hypothetical protein